MKLNYNKHYAEGEFDMDTIELVALPARPSKHERHPLICITEGEHCMNFQIAFLDFGSLDPGGDGLRIGDQLGLLVGALAEGLGVLLERGRGADGRKALGHEIIERVTGLDFYHISGLAEIGNFFLKNDLHNASII